MKFKLIATGMILALTLSVANAQDPIRVGELNSYKAFPSALEPYKLGWRLAVEEINAKGGVLGKKIEVISRDDNGNPGDAVRVAEELVSRKTRIGLGKLIFDPAWTFVRSYVLQRGFLDGLEGLTIAHMAAIYTFLKYAKARNMSPD